MTIHLDTDTNNQLLLECWGTWLPPHVRWVPEDPPLWKTQLLPLLMAVRYDLTLRPHYWRFCTLCTGHAEIKLRQAWKLSFCLLSLYLEVLRRPLIFSVHQQFYSAMNSVNYNNGMKVKGVTNYYLIGFKAHSTSGNLCLVVWTQPRICGSGGHGPRGKSTINTWNIIHGLSSKYSSLYPQANASLSSHQRSFFLQWLI